MTDWTVVQTSSRRDVKVGTGWLRTAAVMILFLFAFESVPRLVCDWNAFCLFCPGAAAAAATVSYQVTSSAVGSGIQSYISHEVLSRPVVSLVISLAVGVSPVSPFVSRSSALNLCFFPCKTSRHRSKPSSYVSKARVSSKGWGAFG